MFVPLVSDNLELDLEGGTEQPRGSFAGRKSYDVSPSKNRIFYISYFFRRIREYREGTKGGRDLTM